MSAYAKVTSGAAVALSTIIAAIILAGGPGTGGGEPTPTPTPGPAEFFVTQTGSGSTCSFAAPCGTLEAAYNAASAGDTVEVDGGTYTDAEMEITSVGPKEGDPVTFTVAAGEAVESEEEWTIKNASNIVIDGTMGLGGYGFRIVDATCCSMMAIGYQGATGGFDTTNITVKGVRLGGNAGTIGQALWLSDCQDITLQQFELHDIFRGDGIQISKGPGDVECEDVLLDEFWVHDMDGVNPDHQDGIQVRAGHDITWRSLLMHDLVFPGSQGIFWNPLGDIGDDGSGHVLENSIIFDVNGNEAYPGGLTEVAFRNNTIDGGIGSCGGGAPTCLGAASLTFTGNLLDVSCADLNAIYDNRVNDAAWSGNVTNANCDGPEQVAPAFGASMFEDPDGNDYHLLSDAFALGKGDQSSYPALDIDGDTRPCGGTVDAGADESC